MRKKSLRERVEMRWVVGKGGPSTDRVKVINSDMDVLADGFKTLKAAEAWINENGYEMGFSEYGQ